MHSSRIPTFTKATIFLIQVETNNKCCQFIDDKMVQCSSQTDFSTFNNFYILFQIQSSILLQIIVVQS